MDESLVIPGTGIRKSGWLESGAQDGHPRDGAEAIRTGPSGIVSGEYEIK